MMSTDTSSSSLTARIPRSGGRWAASRRQALISSTLVEVASSATMSVTEAIRHRHADGHAVHFSRQLRDDQRGGLRRPCRGGNHGQEAGPPPVARRFIQDGLAGGVGMHRGDKEVHNAKLVWSTLATGASELVVQEAMEITWCRVRSYWASFTPARG